MRQKLCLFLVFAWSLTLLSGCSDFLLGDLEDRASRKKKPVETTVATDPTPAPTRDSNPVPESNPYRDYYDIHTGYLLPEADSRYYFRTELTQTDRDWLRLARNEIYARHGYVFKDQNLAGYFSSMDWYAPVPDHDPSGSFNKYEKHNVMLLGLLQDLLDGKAVSLKGKNPYLQYYNPEWEHILTHSGEDVVERWDLLGLDADALKLARNEIFARHGYYFSNENLLTYFALCSWYYPDPGITSTDHLRMSSQENKNVSVIREYEKNPGFDPSNLDTKLNYEVAFGTFSVQLPAYWKDCCIVEKTDNWLSFYQEASYNDYGGHLFSISFHATPDEIEYHPSYAIIGTVTDPDGQLFYIVVTEPTDVQFDFQEYTVGQYSYMYGEMDRIIATIKGINGYTYTPL